jgi:hypothetical protein
MVMAIWWHTPMEPRSLMGEISDMYIGTATVLIPMSRRKREKEEKDSTKLFKT